MKTIVLIAFVALYASAKAGSISQESKIECLKRQSKLGEAEIIKAIEALREKLKNEGLPALGIDSLDPLIIPDRHLEIDNQLIKVDWNVEDVHADGLLGFVIENLKISILTLTVTFTVNFPKVESVVGNYDGKLVLPFLNNTEYSGNGNVDVTVTDFRTKGTGKLALKLINGKLTPQIKTLTIEPTLGGFNFKITGLLNDEDLSARISEQITARVPELLKELTTQINAIIGKLLDVINGIIGGNFYTNQSNRNGLIKPWINCGGY